MNTLELEPYLQKQVDAGSSGTDILHGALKNMMLDCENELNNLSEIQDVPEYKYFSGYMDALTEVYSLTYNLAFAIDERMKARG